MEPGCGWMKKGLRGEDHMTGNLGSKGGTMTSKSSNRHNKDIPTESRQVLTRSFMEEEKGNHNPPICDHEGSPAKCQDLGIQEPIS